MNANQMINMIVRMVMRRVIGRGINAGIDYATRGGKSAGDMTQAEQAQAANTKKTVHSARRGMRMMRRIGRF